MNPVCRVLTTASLCLLACTDAIGPPTAPGPDLAADQANPATSIVVFSRNLYVGANLDAVLAALVTPDPADDFPALLAALETLGATDFAVRAQAIADEIAQTRPMVIGLQEVSRLEVDLTPFGVSIAFTIDFEPILYAALADRGLDYDVAAQNTNIDLDALPGPAVMALRDKEVLLVRADVSPVAAGNKSYDICLHPVPGSCPITIPYPVPISRGFVWARIVLDGVPWTFVSTHSESGNSADVAAIRAVEIGELVTAFGSAPGPVVMMGDFNDRPEADPWPSPDAYDLITGAGGFTDFWRAKHPGATGFTCCHAPDLTNPLGTALDERIDFVFVRGGPGHAFGSIRRSGATPSSRIAGPVYPIWPSDHAGLAAELLLPSEGGSAHGAQERP
ncbi:MAG TPA: endonuclease/exonuclease/phosphatase family protein [Gemmatimonadales bacterium]